MCAWSIVQEEASIVLVGSFNPKIFHPEWFIRKGIVEEWDYKDDEKLIQVQDYAGFSLPDSKHIKVLADKFSVSTPYASEYLTIKDIVAGTFSVLSETPINYLGMNYATTIRLDTNADWFKFGSTLAPRNCWAEAVGYLSDDQLSESGLWELAMTFPRPDKFSGYIRPKIAVKSVKDLEFTFLINNHVDLDEETKLNAVLDSEWVNSLSLASSLINSILKSQLG